MSGGDSWNSSVVVRLTTSKNETADSATVTVSVTESRTGASSARATNGTTAIEGLTPCDVRSGMAPLCHTGPSDVGLLGAVRPCLKCTGDSDDSGLA